MADGDARAELELVLAEQPPAVVRAEQQVACSRSCRGRASRSLELELHVRAPRDAVVVVARVERDARLRATSQPSFSGVGTRRLPASSAWASRKYCVRGAEPQIARPATTAKFQPTRRRRRGTSTSSARDVLRARRDAGSRTRRSARAARRGRCATSASCRGTRDRGTCRRRARCALPTWP